MRLTLIVLTCLTLPLPAAADEEKPWRPVLAVELPFLELPTGKRFELLARYHSWIGTVVFEDTDATFTMNAPSVAHALRDKLTRDHLRVWTVEMTHLEDGGRSYALKGGGRVMSAWEFLSRYEKDAPELPYDRRMAILAWAHRNEAVRSDQKLHEQVIEALLDNLRHRASLASGNQPDLDWIKTGEKLFEKDPRWWEVVVGFARRFGDVPEIAAQLEAQGFARDGNGWRREAEFLTEVGLVRVGDRVIRRERAILEIAIQSWGGASNDITLLRSFTEKQYVDSARAGRLKKGMNCRELIIARSYAKRVTWLRPDGHFYEAWFYANGFRAFFADGLLFNWGRS